MSAERHLRLRVRSDLLTTLEGAAAKSGKTLTAEITHRLQASFENDTRNEMLMEVIRVLAKGKSA